MMDVSTLELSSKDMRYTSDKNATFRKKEKIHQNKYTKTRSKNKIKTTNHTKQNKTDKTI